MQKSNNRKKIDDKQLEQQVMDLLSQVSQSDEPGSQPSVPIMRGEKISAISAFLLFRSGKRLERYSLAILVTTIIQAASMASLVVIIAYALGLFG